MSDKERRREGLMHQVDEGVLSLVEASERMAVSYRQAKRIRSRWKKAGVYGLVHGLRDRPSNRRLADATVDRALELYRCHYSDFGPTLASEKLAERHGLVVHRETLRRALHRAHLWVSGRAARKHRRCRARRECFGQLVQMDGSHHCWFEDRAEKCCVMVMTDDATGRALGYVSHQETTRAAFSTLRLWIESYGVPAGIYADKKTVFFPPPRPATTQEKRSGSGPVTDFGRTCHRLGIELIPAHSPQAKGRVERKNGLLQDRLVKELRLQGISDLTEANAFLPGFIEGLNKRFGVAPVSAVDAHRKAPSPEVLNEVLCEEHCRKVQNDYTLAFEGQCLQLEPQIGLPPPRTSVTVRRRFDGTLAILYHHQPLRFTQGPTKRPRLVATHHRATGVMISAGGRR